MLILQCLIRSVSNTSVDETNRDTGKVTPIWKIQTEHTDAKGELQLQTLKAKTAAQAEGWRKLLGKNVNVPVLQVVNGGKVYLYMIEGQLPTEIPSKATAPAAS